METSFIWVSYPYGVPPFDDGYEYEYLIDLTL